MVYETFPLDFPILSAGQRLVFVLSDTRSVDWFTHIARRWLLKKEKKMFIKNPLESGFLSD